MSLRIVVTDKRGVLRDGACRVLNYLTSPCAAKPDGSGPQHGQYPHHQYLRQTPGRLPCRGYRPVPLHGFGQGIEG